MRAKTGNAIEFESVSTFGLLDAVDLSSRSRRKASARGRSTMPASSRMRLSIEKPIQHLKHLIISVNVGLGHVTLHHLEWREKATVAASTRSFECLNYRPLPTFTFSFVLTFLNKFLPFQN